LAQANLGQGSSAPVQLDFGVEPQSPSRRMQLGRCLERWLHAFTLVLLLPLLHCVSAASVSAGANVHAVAAVGAAERQAAAVTPVQKVLQLLDELLEKGKVDKHDESVRFAAFKEWCDHTGAEKTRVIEAAGRREMQLSADLQKAESDRETLGQEIAELGALVDGWELERQNATSVREAQHAEYTTALQDYSESIDAIRRALATLKARSADVPQALMELRASARSSSRPSEARRELMLAAASAMDGPPQANAYEFQSGSVVEVLEKLLQRFAEERRTLETEETNRRHAYELVGQRLADNIKHGKDARAEKAQFRASAARDAADAKSDLGETQRGKNADEKYLKDMLAGCKQRSSDFEQRQALRAAELEAIQKAIEIISSPTVASMAEKHLPGALMQLHGGPAASTAFVQLRSAGASADGTSRPESLERAAAFLAKRAEEAGSQLLGTVASRVGEDPFAKVKTMIADLLARLQEEANEEADHKGWCDAELASNAKSREQKSAEVSDLTSRVEELTAIEAKLSQEIASLNDEVAELDAAVAEATKARIEEKAKNAATVEEAKQAQVAIIQAMRILKEFYEQVSSSASFAQERLRAPNAMDDAPMVFDGSDHTMHRGATGVLGMMEVIQSDFTRLEAETASAESEASRQHKAFLLASETDKDTKESEARHKGFEKVRKTRELGQTKQELEATQAELDTALNYYEKLKPSCIGTTASYDERVSMRKEEIQSLKEALRILDGEVMSAST